ncbi:hypothetical protein PFJ02_01270 [Mycobacterium xenopi]|uniref:hypothetical protein n=1 Tax=Mycobacterium TaxID=1763 RepID=UPI0008FD26F7|nr:MULTISPECIES: hypothetical protein [Mycobacterium]MDA3637894.1 hypothetical protein [Mycobacterium xenopi]MDA3660719.1 hypothetical protein [Mycobacterium xenopi]ORX09350.1 hypothetical protein AWC32_18305 [Mycobacterium xenopi]PIJ34891.1 hypothetical protein BMW24_010375 [Mycobacterium heckeshornense]
MSPKRGDRVAPPAVRGQWELRFATSEAVKGWESLCQQAAANTATAWNELRSRPQSPAPTPRHHRLKGRLASGMHGGVEMEQWQYEVTGGGRIWYLVDVEKRTLWLRHAGPGHPRETE